MDGLHKEQIVYTRQNVNSETESTRILETNFILPIKTLWDVDVLAYGCRENIIASGLELSKSTMHTPLVVLHLYNIN